MYLSTSLINFKKRRPRIRMKKNSAIQAMLHLTFGVLLLLCGCAKDGNPVEESKETILYFQAFSADTMRLGIKMNNEIVFNDFYIPTLTARALSIKYYGDNQRKITIYNTGENRVMFDTVLSLKPTPENITLYQQASGQPFVYIAPPVNESFPPDGYGKISVNYTLPALPERVEVVVQNSIAGGPDYDSTDSFILGKGEFSRYFLGRTNQARKPQLLLYSTEPGRKLLAKIETGEYSDMNLLFTIYSARSSNAVQNGVYLLQQDKLY